jgi:putative tryptophan/tyrosine transport system substrate-binding protein
LGYVDGQNVVVERRSAYGEYDRLAALAAELVRLKVDVLVVTATPGVLAAKNATKTIPTVMVGVGDPLTTGIVGSLARPGGNLTGLSLQNPELSGKRVQLLKETLPRVSRVAVLLNPTNPIHAVFWRATQDAAAMLGVQVTSLEVRTAGDFERAYESATTERSGALNVLDDPLSVSGRRRIIDLAASHRLPTMYGFREFVEAGGLMSYGPNLRDHYRRAARYVDKILKGAKAGDLPVEQPTLFELVINLKTAKAIGLTIPPSVLGRADHVIE